MRYTEKQAVRKWFLPASSKENVRKGLWSPEEDEKLIAYLVSNDTQGSSWTRVAMQAGLQRSGKSCRLRWINYLRPGVKRGAFSREEEWLIVNLQSILGNRWAQIAIHLPGRTDNEIKNYWNTSIKKKLNSKRHILHRSAQPYLDVVPEGYQKLDNTFNVVPSGENQLPLRGLMELKQEEVEDQNNEINQLISCYEMSMTDTSTNTHESITSRAAFQASTGITIPAHVVKTECLKEKVENGGIWSTSHSHSNADNWSHLVNPEAYTGHETDFVSVLAKDYESLYEKTTHQSCPRPSFESQFDAPSIKLSAGQYNDHFQAWDDCRDPVNLRYDINLADPKYIDIYSGQKSYQLHQIHRKGVGDQQECSTVPYQETNANPISTLSEAGRGSGRFEIDCKIKPAQVTLSAHDDMYNLSTAAALDLDEIYYNLHEISLS